MTRLLTEYIHLSNEKFTKSHPIPMATTSQASRTELFCLPRVRHHPIL
jgi:hypothetical protein